MNLLITQRTLRHTDSDFLKTGETNSSLMSLDNLFLVVVNFYPRRNSVNGDFLKVSRGMKLFI